MVGMVEIAGDWWAAERPMARRRLVTHLADLLWDGFATLGEGLAP